MACGIKLAEAGRQVAIVARGQSTLHFSSGSFDLLGYTPKGEVVAHPIDAVNLLPASHPYNKIGRNSIVALAQQAKELLLSSSIKVKGEAQQNHFRITPMGVMKPTWLTLEDYATSESSATLPYRKVVLANIAGFLDFPQDFIAEGMRRLGTEVKKEIINIPALKARRHSPTEMRSANIARILSIDETLNQIADLLNETDTGIEAIYLPAIVGLDAQDTAAALKDKVKKPLYFIATIPPSVPGIRVEKLLRKRFNQLGGIFLTGSTITGGKIENGSIKYIEANNLPDEQLTAKEYILATGSFQSEGLMSNYERVYEPVFDLDVDALDNRPAWTAQNVYDEQPYMKFGVHTNEHFQTMKGGITISNLYAVGSVLSGHNTIKTADGTGVDLLTALHVANNILNQNQA